WVFDSFYICPLWRAQARVVDHVIELVEHDDRFRELGLVRADDMVADADPRCRPELFSDLVAESADGVLASLRVPHRDLLAGGRFAVDRAWAHIADHLCGVDA